MPAPPIFDLTGKVAVVTGAGSGIGRATTQVLADAGAAVVAADIDKARLDETVEMAPGAAGRVVGHPTDVRDRAAVDALVDRAVTEFGRLDFMANIAGAAFDGMLADVTEEQLDAGIALNLKGVLWGCQAALRVMAPQGSGSIANVSSGAIDKAFPGIGIYALTKAAVAMMTMTLAVEAGPLGVRVNALAPGTTLTNFTMRRLYRPDGSTDPAALEEFVQWSKDQSPLGIMGEPTDQAYQMLYLASDASRYVTGAILRANGGQIMVW